VIKTKKKILEETERLFFRYGIRNITMDDIARQLTISKKTLYEYFHDKDELVYDVLKAHIEIDKKEMSEAQHAAKDALEEIVKVSEVIKKYEAYGKKKFMGREFLGTQRKTFLISPDGEIMKEYYGMDLKTHAQEILKDIDPLL
jgi:AcrR family transcriptional regulator